MKEWSNIKDGYPKEESEYLLKLVDLFDFDHQIFHEVASWDGSQFHMCLDNIQPEDSYKILSYMKIDF